MSLPIVNEGASAKEVRSALQQAAHEVIKLRGVPADQRPTDFKDEVRSHVDFINEMDAVERALSRSERERPESNGPSAAHGIPAQRSRSIGERLTDSDEYRSFAQSHRSASTFHEATIDGSLFQRALISEGSTFPAPTGGGVFVPGGTPIPPTPRTRRLTMRDLLPVIPTTLPTVPYIQELNPAALEGGASAVAEGAPKPEVEMNWERKDAPVRKIAAWVPVTTEIIEDAPTLMGYVEARLVYMIALREDQQLINGPGTGAQILGLRNQTGKQLQAAVAGDVPATLGLAYAKVENVDGDPDGVVMNPTDYWSAVVSRHSTQFDNGFGGNAPATASSISWGEPVVRSRSIEAGKALAGAFQLAAAILDRQQTTIRVGNQHSDYFTNNKVVVLAEERVGLMVPRPDLIVECTITH